MVPFFCPTSPCPIQNSVPASRIRRPQPGLLRSRAAPGLSSGRRGIGCDPRAGQRASRSAHLSSPAPGLRRPTRHLSPALPAHTPRTPASPRALPPPTLRLPPLTAGAAPASQGVGAPRGSAATRELGFCGPWHPEAGFLTFDLHLPALDPPLVGSARFSPLALTAALLSIPESEKTILTRLLP